MSPFGTALPVIQAPMAGVQGSALAIAVSNAGALGSLPCATLTPEALRGELINRMLQDPAVAAALDRWRPAVTT